MTQKQIRIIIEGERASGKTLLLNRIRRLLSDELNNHTARLEDEKNNDHHTMIATLCDTDRSALATLPLSIPDQLRAVARFSAHPVAVCQMAENLANAMENPGIAPLVTTETAAETVEADVSFFVSRTITTHVGDVTNTVSASITVPTIGELTELHDAGTIETILKDLTDVQSAS